MCCEGTLAVVLVTVDGDTGEGMFASLGSSCSYTVIVYKQMMTATTTTTMIMRVDE